jgi:glc operon protein GlcG
MIALLIALIAPATGASAQMVHTSVKPVLTLAGAKVVAMAGVAEAKRLNAPGGAIAVVDDGGNLLYLERLDNTFAAAARVAEGKARTAALFRRATKGLEDAIVSGRTTLLNVAETPLQGGVPIVVNGAVIGAVGVSGAASADQDTELAVAAAKAMLNIATVQGDDDAAPVAGITYLEGGKVRAAFEKGAPLIEVHDYKIHASRREGSGMAEIHERDTDIIYVLDGSATFVTGGEIVDARTTAPEEIRGASIEGGETRTLARGDVMVVPAGTAHWFKNVKGPFLYYVVKVSNGLP